MSQRTFAEILTEALDSRAVTAAEAARWLGVARSTVYHWLGDETRPAPSHYSALADLPRRLGQSPAEKTRFLAEVAAALGYSPPVAAASTAGIAHRRHYGADDLPPFAGRAAELAELRRAVGNGHSVLITGMGGMGKTRLAQELLHECVAGFAHGCEFLTLDASQDGGQVIRNVAHLLGLPLPPEAVTPANRRLALDRLARQMEGARLLFLVDNVAEAGQVRDLVQGLHAITWVFTARRASLKRIGVHSLHLRLPDAADAAAIFRAHLPAALVADSADDRLLGRVVDKVGGLPFALRLAAAVLANGLVSSVAELDGWLAAGGLGRAGSPTKKLDRLFDSMLHSLPPAAHRTLLLCGVFAAPTVRLPVAQAVAAAAGYRPTPDDWATLEDYSLIEFPDHECATLHARLHEHVGRRLRASPHHAAARVAYLAHYVALAEEVGRPPETERDYRPLVPEESDLLAVAEALHAAGDWAELRRLYPALTGYLWRAGRHRAYAQVDRWCLDAAEALYDEGWTIKILSELGYVQKEAGEWAEAERLFQRCQTLYDATPEDFISRARLRRYRAEVALGRGDNDGALALLGEAETLLARIVEPSSNLSVATMLLHSARMTAHHRRGALALAEADGWAAERLYQVVRSYGEFRVELGDILRQRGQVDETVALWEDELAHQTGLPNRPADAELRLRLAWAYVTRGEIERAGATARAATEGFDRFGLTARAALAERVLAAVSGGGDMPSFELLIS